MNPLLSEALLERKRDSLLLKPEQQVTNKEIDEFIERAKK